MVYYYTVLIKLAIKMQLNNLTQLFDFNLLICNKGYNYYSPLNLIEHTQYIDGKLLLSFPAIGYQASLVYIATHYEIRFV